MEMAIRNRGDPPPPLLSLFFVSSAEKKAWNPSFGDGFAWIPGTSRSLRATCCLAFLGPLLLRLPPPVFIIKLPISPFFSSITMDSSASSSSSSSPPSSSGQGSLSMSGLEVSLASCCLPCSPPPFSCGSGRGFDVDESVELSHFLELCFLCGKSLAGNCDIFMYRGDTPFCSVECRQQQIEIDEAREKRWRLSVKASDSKEERKKSAAGAKAQKIQVTAVAG